MFRNQEIEFDFTKNDIQILFVNLGLNQYHSTLATR